MTVTEAKTQAVLEAGFRATGTASDAICIAAPAAGEPQDFAGPRSLWGARIACAVHSATYAGGVHCPAKRQPCIGTLSGSFDDVIRAYHPGWLTDASTGCLAGADWGSY